MLPDYPDYFWLTAVIAMILIGLSKAGFGSGVGVLATPLVALTIPVADAAALLLPLLILADLLAVRHYRGSVHTPSLKRLLPGALVGIGFGSFLFGYFSHNEQVLKTIIGVIALLFVLFQALRTLILGTLEAHRPSTVAGVGLGIVSGFTSTLAHVGGPPATMYLLPQKLPRHIFVGSTVLYFMIVNLVKLVPYAFLGLIRVGNLTTVLILAPLAYLGVRIGIRLVDRFNDLWFNRMIYALLLLTGVQLIMGNSIIGLLFG